MEGVAGVGDAGSIFKMDKSENLFEKYGLEGALEIRASEILDTSADTRASDSTSDPGGRVPRGDTNPQCQYTAATTVNLPISGDESRGLTNLSRLSNRPRQKQAGGG